MDINLKDFDLNKFLLGKPLVLESEDMKIFKNICEDVARNRDTLCLVAPPGCGVESFLNQYKDTNFSEVFILDCLKSIEKVFGDLMMDIQLGHRLANWYDTDLMNVIEALLHYLNEMNNRTLLIFNNCDYLKVSGLKDLFVYLRQIKDYTGIIFRITPDFGEKILKGPDVRLRSFIAESERFVVDYPTEKDLMNACFENGIISKTVAYNLVRETFDFDVISTRVRNLLRDVNIHLNKNDKPRKG